MAEVFLPPWIQPQGETTALLDDSTSVFRAAYAPGVAQRVSYVEPRLQVKQSFRALRGVERAAMLSFLAGSRGKFATVRAAVGYANRGSFPTLELLANNDFKNGTTNWASYGSSNATLSVADQVLRLKMLNVASTQFYGITQAFSNSAPYPPTAVRAYTRNGRQLTVGQAIFVQNRDNVFSTFGIGAGPGLAGAFSGGYASTQAIIYQQALSGNVLFPGDYFDTTWTSAAQCALVDGAGNLFTHSDIVGSTGWTNVATTYALSGSNPAPDQSLTASNLIETVANSTHSAQQAVTVPATVHDFTVSLFVQQSASRTWCYISISDNVTTICTQYFNLNSMALGTVTTGSPANTAWTNMRATIEDCGNAWRRITLTARKMNSAATTLTPVFGVATADNTPSYTGSTSSGLGVWRASCSVSPCPALSTLTTSAAVAAAAQTGNSLRIKGLPASSNGLLLAGDMIEINGELKILSSQMDSDGAGCGFVHFHPPMTRAANDNDGVVIKQPMGKFILSENPQWTNNLGAYLDVDLTMEAINE